MIKTIALILLVSSCSMQKKSLHQGWKSILSIDNNGLVLSGEKQNLIDAIHMGCPIRVGWFRKLRNDETLGHVTDSAFLSVYKGEVFAQVKPIMRQSPSSAKAAIQLDFENNQQWTAIISSDGKLHSTLSGSKKSGIRKIASKWYINTNNCRVKL